jgi:hypothetical protein
MMALTDRTVSGTGTKLRIYLVTLTVCESRRDFRHAGSAPLPRNGGDEGHGTDGYGYMQTNLAACAPLRWTPSVKLLYSLAQSGSRSVDGEMTECFLAETLIKTGAAVAVCVCWFPPHYGSP